MARRWMPASNQARFGAGIIALAWAFVVERATRIELALSAWEVCGVADPLPADRRICGPIGHLSVVDRERPPALVRSGTWRARASLSRT